MEGQSSLNKQAKFSQRILCCSLRILRSLMPSEHPECVYCIPFAISVQGRRAGGPAAHPVGKKNSIILAKLMYHLAKTK